MKTRPPEWNDPAAVDEFLEKLDHPLKPVLEASRRTILGTDKCVTEGIKWNAPSFYCNEWFATANLRKNDEVLIVLHLGAKVKDNSTGMRIEDPDGLLTWPAKDRAVARFGSVKEFKAKQPAFKAVLGQWVEHMKGRA